MRILVLQLARFGDIYQSWPALRALQRTHPGSELHVLVRERFQEALHGLPGVLTHVLPTADVLEPLFTDGDEHKAHERLTRVLQPLIDLQFDLIINLSFSPLASYLTDLLAHGATEVRGYTRHADGHFHIPDDTAAYFYAQVGIGRANRYHVSDLFAAVSGVDLTEGDHWVVPPVADSARQGVLIHLGASQAEKRYPPERWVQVIEDLARGVDQPMTLIGSNGEAALAATVCARIDSPYLINRVGQSTLAELMEWIGVARLVIGADSAPVHIAALCATPVLNLSSATVNFWETGPRSAASRILYADDLSTVEPQRVSAEARAMLHGLPPTGPCVVRDNLAGPYRLHDLNFDDFAWQLIEALYTGTAFPECIDTQDLLAFQRLFEIAELALRQLDLWSEPKTRAAAAQILAQVDTMLPEVARIAPRVAPVVHWFETERLRIPPGTADETLQRTRRIFADLHLVSAVYRRFLDPRVEIDRALALCREIAPELREYNPMRVQSALQSLVPLLHELSRHSTKVADESWSSVLREFDDGITRRDFIAVADLLEWKLMPALSALLTERETLSQDVLS
jgi:ADP-heptose:LPS heptosyltransferase